MKRSRRIDGVNGRWACVDGRGLRSTRGRTPHRCIRDPASALFW